MPNIESELNAEIKGFGWFTRRERKYLYILEDIWKTNLYEMYGLTYKKGPLLSCVKWFIETLIIYLNLII